MGTSAAVQPPSSSCTTTAVSRSARKGKIRMVVSPAGGAVRGHHVDSHRRTGSYETFKTSLPGGEPGGARARTGSTTGHRSKSFPTTSGCTRWGARAHRDRALTTAGNPATQALMAAGGSTRSLFRRDPTRTLRTSAGNLRAGRGTGALSRQMDPRQPPDGTHPGRALVPTVSKLRARSTSSC